MPKVKWGVLGCAGFARKRAIPAMLQTPSVDLVCVASRSREKAESFRNEFGLARAYSSYEAMLEDPEIEAVHIPLPNSLHAEWAIKAAEAGKHSLVEKPFTADAAQARRVEEATTRHGVQAMEAFAWRLHAQHEMALERVYSNSIGRVRLVRAAYTFPLTTKPNVRLVPELAGGSVLDLGCYAISAARYYFADEPTSAYARGEIDPEYQVDMRVSGVLIFPAGRALMDCSFDLPYRMSLEVVGENGIIAFPKPWQPDPETTILINDELTRFPKQNQFVAMFEHFSQCLIRGIAPRFGPSDAVRQMKAVDAVLRSIRRGLPEAV